MNPTPETHTPGLPGLTLREAGPDDLGTLAHLLSASNPDHPQTAQGLAHHLGALREHPLRPLVRHWLTERGGEALGLAELVQYPGMFHPDRYHADVQVLPAARGRGVGRWLTEHLERELAARGAREVLAGAYETAAPALGLLRRSGFEEALRYFDNVLDLSGFDAAHWSAQATLPAGVRAVTLADLSAQWGEEAARRAMFGAVREIREDVPRPGAATEIRYEDFAHRLSGPDFFPQGVLLAVTEPEDPATPGEVVALSELFRSEAGPQRLDTGLTGTRRAWRRRGLALALKVRALALARELGAREVWTGNATSNAPMLSLNTRLGFRPRPAWIEFRRGQVED
ncbi:Ribosomal protein S18 acetylase RimI [Deinococcus reticulitermitis]|uniref:Ribosomal protein S18 acetylase RimI n=1 Tax=Deinococcus reticulitermitis TaxID=856736 RepID=A0A1H6SFP1_9DEIO|nr:GNAT family N-acetyltransferase [Deinococcus reticulitermitis]SEI63637.1 Ribosomal protein S18 acetylase RimI [Deinococcus reticulitermitis]